MVDKRTLYPGQGSPYETRPEASPYYFKAPKPSRALSGKSIDRLVKKWEPILLRYKTLSDQDWLDYFTALKRELDAHNAKYPDDAIVVRDKKGKPVLLYSTR